MYSRYIYIAFVIFVVVVVAVAVADIDVDVAIVAVCDLLSVCLSACMPASSKIYIPMNHFVVQIANPCRRNMDAQDGNIIPDNELWIIWVVFQMSLPVFVFVRTR